MTPGAPTAGHAQHPTHGFDELSLMLFDKDILHVRRFAKYVAAFLENSQLLCLLRKLVFKQGIFSSQFAFALR